ncbi:dihydropteroate synthase [Candidatus Poriferisodalis sp.]|uniref:dihydropteroate synthase n=1 Tax=Candidatus Poriferisodalis sp. TaxID=3101277 RepID=UPI003B023D2E
MAGAQMPPGWPIRRRYRHGWWDPGRGPCWQWGSRTFVMGIINATDDSFSGDGVADRLDEALALTHELTDGGVDIIDIGGASSRPGAEPTPVEVERKRAVRVIEAVRAELDRTGADVPISVDTTWAEVAGPAFDAGATVVNDITGFRLDPRMAPLVAERGAAAVLMHNQRGRPHTDLIADVTAGLKASLQICAEAGVSSDRIVVDPGFGFGFGVSQNLEMMRRLPELWALELPMLIGTSRKSTIGAVTNAEIDDRLFGTAATITAAICAGIDIVRVHDTAQMAQAIRMTDAIVRPAR